jgi:hypothetical protein
MSDVPLSELRLGDVVRLGPECYSDATVKRIDDGTVTVHRPYIHAADFAYGGGVILYVGTEILTLAGPTVCRVRAAV